MHPAEKYLFVLTFAVMFVIVGRLVVDEIFDRDWRWLDDWFNDRRR